MNAVDSAKLHRYTREKGCNPLLYWVAWALLQLLLRVKFRLKVVGAKAIPKRGPVLVISNHRSFSDSFFLCMGIRRPVNFMAKRELFKGPLAAWLLSRLGAFPVDRGASDREAIRTATLLLEAGRIVQIFPEGTRVRPGPLAMPKKGAGVLALKTGAPLVPATVSGTEDIRSGWLIRLRRVRVRFGSAYQVSRTERPTAVQAGGVIQDVWPAVEEMWEQGGGCPRIRKAAVIGAGSWGTAVAILLDRAGCSVQLACNTLQQVAEIEAMRLNQDYLPDEAVPDSIRATTAEKLHWEGLGLICLAVPARSLPRVAEDLACAGADAPLLILSKGLVELSGRLPSEYLHEALGVSRTAVLGGPAHAAEAVKGRAGLVVGSRDDVFRSQLAAVFRAAGLPCEGSDDAVGVELAGIAKNAAAIGAAAAGNLGANVAGSVAASIFSECVELAVRWGAGRSTFLGPAGVGDLVATVLSPGSRNWRAGKMLAGGMAAAGIAKELGQTAEGLSLVPLLSTLYSESGVAAPATDALAAVVEGRMQAESLLSLFVLAGASHNAGVPYPS